MYFKANDFLFQTQYQKMYEYNYGKKSSKFELDLITLKRMTKQSKEAEIRRNKKKNKYQEILKFKTEEDLIFFKYCVKSLNKTTLYL